MEKMEAAGISSIERLADMSVEQLLEIPGIGEKMVEKIRLAVTAYFEALEGGAASAADAPPADGDVVEEEADAAAGAPAEPGSDAAPASEAPETHEEAGEAAGEPAANEDPTAAQSENLREDQP